MKKILLIFTFMVLSGCFLQSKASDKNEFMISGGYFSRDAILIKMFHSGNNFTERFNRYYHLDKVKRFGDYSFSYKYRLLTHLYLGAVVAYTPTKTEVFNSTELANANKIKLGDLYYHFVTFAAEINAIYLDRPIFKLYGNAGVGYSLGKIKFHPTSGGVREKAYNHFNFQISPICFRVGRKVGGFAEIGYGYKGIVSLGCYATF